MGRWLKVAKEEGMSRDDLFELIEASVATLISLQTNKIGDSNVGFEDTKTREFMNKYHQNLTDMMREVISNQV